MSKKHSPPKPAPRKTFRRVPQQPRMLMLSGVLLAVWMVVLLGLAIFG